MFENKKAILFDLDGTLIESAPDLASALNAMLERLGHREFSQQEIRAWIGNGAAVLVQRALQKALGREVEMKEEYFNEALKLFLSLYEERMCVETYLFPMVQETLQTLKNHGKKIAIVTNKPSKFIEPILENLQISKYVDYVVGADTLKHKKPHPAPLLHVCDIFGIGVKEALMVGDSRNDVEAARACGMDVVGVDYGYNYEQSIEDLKPDVVVSGIEEIVSLVGIAPRVAVVGGGVAGSSVALHLARKGAKVDLFEKKESLIDGPPMCHLHAGGNLYREIDDKQCLQLLRESIEFVRFYPEGIDPRPTVIAVPLEDGGSIEELLPRLKMLQKEYARLVQEDEGNKVLGEVEDYFQLFSKEEMLRLRKKEVCELPTSMEEWMIPFAKYIDLDKIRFPVLVVQEFGLNLFRLSAAASLRVKQKSNINLYLQSEVVQIQDKQGEFDLTYKSGRETKRKSYDYLVNAAGFQSGVIDDMLGLHVERFVEFKAAYVTHWQKVKEHKWPEIIFHGKRGTPQGMAQFTPYAGGYVQLHGMTKEITLFDNGLVKSSGLSSLPKLPQLLLEKILKSWDEKSVKERTTKAIKHAARYIPALLDADDAYKPLYGAQQIPGKDHTLRAAEFSFEGNRYARCEIVKVSSVVAMAEAIYVRLRMLGFLQKEKEETTADEECIDEKKLAALVRDLAKRRGYPAKMAELYARD